MRRERGNNELAIWCIYTKEIRGNIYLTSAEYTNANNKDVSTRFNSLPASTGTPDVVWAVTPSDREKPRALVMEAGPASSIRTLKYYPERRAGFLHSRAGGVDVAASPSLPA